MRFVEFVGPANTGKMPLAHRMMQNDAALTLVHRDFIRSSLERQIDEWHVTLLMADMVRRLLSLGHSAIVCAWNMELADRALWIGIATEHSVELEWLDVREPEVAALIPPMAARQQYGRQTSIQRIRPNPLRCSKKPQWEAAGSTRV